EIAEQLPGARGDFLDDERNQPGEKMKRDDAKGDDRGDDLVLRQSGGEAADRKIKHAEQKQHEIGAEIRAHRIRGGLMRDQLENPEVKQRRQPEDEIENQGTEEFREHDLPISDRRRHEGLDRAELKFLREQAHRDERKNQDESEPEEDRIEERFLDGIADRLPVHERKLEI